MKIRKIKYNYLNLGFIIAKLRRRIGWRHGHIDGRRLMRTFWITGGLHCFHDFRWDNGLNRHFLDEIENFIEIRFELFKGFESSHRPGSVRTMDDDRSTGLRFKVIAYFLPGNIRINFTKKKLKLQLQSREFTTMSLSFGKRYLEQAIQILSVNRWH